MSDNIFTNYPTWTGTKATDTSNILDSLANAYNKQQQSFEGLATLHDDFWKTAQKQHQQDAVHFLNNMSADNLVKQDAKQNFLNALKQQGEDIGGYSNMPEWDALYDSRVNTAIANENAIKNHKVAQVTDDIKAAAAIANNVTGTNSPDEVNKAVDYLNNLDRHYGDDSTKLQAAINALTTAKQDAFTAKANLDALYEASTKNDYEKLVAPTMNSYINKWGIASAMVRIGKATGDENLVKQGQDTISSLSNMFNKKGAVGADGQQITEDGGLTSFIAQQPKNVQDYFFKHFDNWKNEATDRHHKQFSSDSQLSLAVAKQLLAQEAYNLERDITNHGSWYQRQQIQNEKDKTNIQAAKVQAGIFGEGNSSGGNSKSSATKHLSYSKNSSYDKEYEKLGLPHITITNTDGEEVLNSQGVLGAFNNFIQKVTEKDYSKMRDELNLSEYANSRNVYGYIGSPRVQTVTEALNASKYTELAMTDYEKIYLTYRLIKTKGAGNGTLGTAPSDGWVKRNLQELRDNRDREIKEGIQERLSLISKDLTNYEMGAIILELGMLDAGMDKYLTKEQLIAAKAVRGDGNPIPTNISKPDVLVNYYSNSRNSGIRGLLKPATNKAERINDKARNMPNKTPQ